MKKHYNDHIVNKEAPDNSVSDLLQGGYIANQVQRRFDVSEHSVTPPLPEKIAIEINNSCNHKCYFCPNPIMSRQRSTIDDDLLYNIIQDAYNEGIREISFYSTGEPFLNRKLPDYVRRAKETGFDYVFLSSNGGRVVSSKIQSVLDAGLDSLKFSINAGNRQTYEIVHGEDDFDTVLQNVALVSEYRKKHRPGMKLFVSFVETDLNRDSFEELKTAVGNMVDEVIRYPFAVIGTPLLERPNPKDTTRPFTGYAAVEKTNVLSRMRTTLPCYQLWSYLNVTVEGYLSACCSDFNDDLIVGNLKRMSLKNAWHSEEFQKLRQQHKNRQIAGTLCDGCVAQKARPFKPLNDHLRD